MAVRVSFECGHSSTLKPKKTSEGFTHDWEVFVRGVDNADIGHYVDRVIFSLHETFPRPKRVLKEPPYVVRESGYAGFALPIQIYLKTEKNEPKRFFEVEYDLELQTSGPPDHRLTTCTEVVQNCSDELRKRLLRGGGIIVSDSAGANDIKSSMLGKLKTSSSNDSSKRHRSSEPKPTNEFSELFGPPIKTSKTEVRKPPDKANLKPPPPVPPVVSNDKNDKSKTKHSPHKDGSSVKKEQDRAKEKRDLSKDKSSEKTKEKPRQSATAIVAAAIATSQAAAVPVKEKVEKEKKEIKEVPKVTESVTPVKSDRKKEKKKHKEDREKEKKDKHRSGSSSSKSKGDVSIPKPEKPKSEKPKSSEKSEKPEKSEKSKSKPEEKEKKEKHKHKKKDKKDRRDGSRERKRERTKSNSVSNNHESAGSGDEDTLILNTPLPPKKEFVAPNPPPPQIVVTEIPKQPPPQTIVPEKKRDRTRSSRNESRESRKKKRTEKDKSASPILEPVSSSQSPVEKVPLPKEEPKLPEPEVEQVAPDSTNNSFAEPEEPMVFSEDYVSQLKDLQRKIMTMQDNQELQRVVQVIAETGQYEITKKTFDFDLCALDRRTVQRLQQFFAS